MIIKFLKFTHHKLSNHLDIFQNNFITLNFKISILDKCKRTNFNSLVKSKSQILIFKVKMDITLQLLIKTLEKKLVIAVIRMKAKNKIQKLENTKGRIMAKVSVKKSKWRKQKELKKVQKVRDRGDHLRDKLKVNLEKKIMHH